MARRGCVGTAIFGSTRSIGKGALPPEARPTPSTAASAARSLSGKRGLIDVMEPGQQGPPEAAAQIHVLLTGTSCVSYVVAELVLLPRDGHRFALDAVASSSLPTK